MMLTLLVMFSTAILAHAQNDTACFYDLTKCFDCKSCTQNNIIWTPSAMWCQRSKACHPYSVFVISCLSDCGKTSSIPAFCDYDAYSQETCFIGSIVGLVIGGIIFCIVAVCFIIAKCKGSSQGTQNPSLTTTIVTTEPQRM